MDGDLPSYLLAELKIIADKEQFIEFKIEPSDNSTLHGTGQLGSIVSVTITGKVKKSEKEIVFQKIPLICKILPSNVQQCDMFDLDSVFKREAYMYNTILPLMVDFQKKHGLTKEAGFFAFPKCYAAVGNMEKKNFVIIMEDIRAKGYRLWDKFKPMDLDYLNAIFKALGRLHALSFALRQKNPEVFEKLKQLDDPMGRSNEQNAKTNLLDVYMTSYQRCSKMFVDDDELLAGMEKLKNNFENILYKRCEPLNAAEPYGVVLHGDCWNNNVMFGETAVSLNLIIMFK